MIIGSDHLSHSKWTELGDSKYFFFKQIFFRTGEIGPNGKPSVECEDCGKVLADPSSLYRHRKIHTGEKPHKCPYCDR